MDTFASGTRRKGKRNFECSNVCGEGGEVKGVKLLEPKDIEEPSKKVDRQMSWYERFES